MTRRPLIVILAVLMAFAVASSSGREVGVTVATRSSAGLDA